MRRTAHLLDGSELTAAEVVRRAVALQGQDLPGVLRAIALRSTSGTTLADVKRAFDDGTLVRSWPMRGTLFATTPEHLAGLRHFTAERTHRSTVRRREQLGLDDATLARAEEVMATALSERSLTRAEALATWEEAGIGTEGGRGYHLLFHHAVGGTFHWGPFAEGGTEQLLTLTEAVAVDDPDQALIEIIRGYVAARAPVTDADLAWWTKLPKTTLRKAAAQVLELVDVTVEGESAWVLAEQLDAIPAAAAGIDLVPAFDEWILGYGDRSLVATDEMMQAVVPGGNGMFRPTVLVDGTVVGTWKLKPRKGEDAFTAVAPVSAADRKRIDKALADWSYV